MNIQSMYSNSVAEVPQSHMLARVSFCPQGTAWVTPTEHLGNMICACLLEQPRQRLNDFISFLIIMSNFFAGYSNFSVNSNIALTLYQASHLTYVLLIT